MQQTLLDARLSASYAGRGQVLRDVDLQLYRGEVAGLIGSSGCGKSTLARAILNLPSGLMKVSGYSLYKGQDLLRISGQALRRLRGKEIAYVAQSPSAALNPALTVLEHLSEAWRAHKAYNLKDTLPRFS